MKKVSLLLLFITTIGFSQLLFNQHTIATNIDDPKAVYVVDIDNDNDADIVCAIYRDDKIIWYENDGSQNFNEHNISTNADGAQHVFAVDLDQDGDMDVLSASEYDDKIAWYENDGTQSFTEHVISTNEDYAYFVGAIDLDQDGDIDVYSTSWNDNRVVWHENDGSQNFTTHIITTDWTKPYSAFAIDFDQDGDIDILSTASSSGVVLWHENDGSQNFSTNTVSNDAPWAKSVYAIDIDGDNDLDVLSTNVSDGVYWYENDGSESSFSPHIIQSGWGLTYSYPIDINFDNYIDVIITNYSDADLGIIVALNDGIGNFVIDTISSSPSENIDYIFPYDLDGDSDIDIIASKSSTNDEVYWCENLGPSVLYVSITGSDETGNGTANNPFATIQKGIDASSDGRTVLVTAGVYFENINYNGKNIAVIGENRETTIIDGNQNWSVVLFENEEDSTAVLSGFTITNAGSNNYGGVSIENSSPTIENCIISENYSLHNGGGININWSNPKIINVIITNNHADMDGGGIYSNSSAYLNNVTIANNSATGDGGGIYCMNSSPSLNNVTIIDTSTSGNGGLIHSMGSSNPILVNCILWNNTSQVISLEDGSVDASYSDIKNGWEGEGNIDADPLFVDADNYDFNLQWGSPCIDSGDPDLDGDGYTWETDTDDQDPNGTRMDMGAFYFSQFIPDFTAEPISGFSPLEVQFTDLSYVNIINWEWDFNNDGTTDSDEENPSHTFTESGLYSVSLIVNDGTNESVEIKENYILVYPSNLIITEIMQNPSAVNDNEGEWFEIFNQGNMDADLIGCVIKDSGTDYHVINTSLLIESGHYYVLGNNADYNTNGGVNLGYQYSDIFLGNGSDEIILISPQGNLIDSVGWDNGSTFPDPNGASMALFDTVLDNSVGSNWTVSVTPYGDGDLGTPGIPNFNPTILVSEEEIIFTDVMVGLSDTYDLEITNNGNGGLIIDTVYFDNDVFDPGFTTAIIEVGDPILLPVIFTPLAVGTYSASLFIETNDYNNQIFSINVQGYGIEPNPNIYINPDTLDFGVVSIGDSGHVWFTIYNIGVNDLEIAEVEFGLGEESPFFTDFEEATISSQEDTSVIIHYVYPEQRVAFEDTFYIYSNDPDEGVYELPIMVDTPTNSPPMITSDDSVTANEDSYFKYTATAEDPEDSTIIFSFDQLASWLTADADSVYGTPSDGDADTSFRVIASDGDLEDSLIVYIDIIHINDPPNEFALLTPEAESMIQTLTPLFEWEASFDPDPTDTVSYTLFYGDSIPALQIIEVGTELSYQDSSDLNDNTTYFWKVIATDENGASTENISGYHRFYTNMENDPPSAVTLVTPTDNSIEVDLSPIFYWTEADDPDPMDHISYTMYWWPMGVVPVIYSTNTDSNSFTPEENLTDNSQFGWMVTANDMHGAQSSSDSSHFYTDAFPEPPTNFATVAPENEVEGIATEVEFIWNLTYDPDPLDEIHYQVVYATDWEDSSTYVFSELIQDTSLTVTLANNSQYYWIVVAMDTDGFMVGSDNNTPMTVVVGTLSIDGADIPEVFALHQNHPNPFNPTTQIRYDLPEDAMVSIIIYDLMGRSIKSLVNINQSAGYRSIQWNATNNIGQPVSAGLYLYTIQAGQFRQTKKMVLLK